MAERKLRSDMEFGVAWAERRALLKGLGRTDEGLRKPQIAIIDSWSEINPGHMHLRELAKEVEKGVREAGGEPYHFTTLGLCDGIALVGAEYILPSRDLIANEVEVIIGAYKMDAMVLLATCDKIVPAYCMAAAYLNIPAIIVTGGYMQNGEHYGKPVTFCSVGRSVGAAVSGLISYEECQEIIDNTCKCPGACGMMGTANTMCIVAEALGLSLSGNSTVAAVSKDIKQIAYRAGKQIMNLWENNITPREILSESAIKNAYIACMAVGGSTNAMVHIPAIAAKAGLEIDCLKYADFCSHEIPLLLGVEPNGEYTMKDFDLSGGLKSIYKILGDKVYQDALTVSGLTVKEVLEGFEIPEESVICTLNQVLAQEGALAVLRGNLAPDCSLVKQSAVPPHMMKFRGPARVFDSNEEAITGLRNGHIKEGDVVVIRFCGARGGPGLITTFMFTSELAGSALNGKVALITDGRFSGATEGACIGYISPEAALYGPLLALQDGDMIAYDIPNRSLDVELTEDEMKSRLANVELNMEIRDGWLGIYQKTVGVLSKGAILSGKER